MPVGGIDDRTMRRGGITPMLQRLLDDAESTELMHSSSAV